MTLWVLRGVSTAFFAVRVAVLTPFKHHTLRDWVSLFLLCEQLADVGAIQIYPRGAVGQLIDRLVDLRFAAETAVSLGWCALGAEYGGPRRVAPVFC